MTYDHGYRQLSENGMFYGDFSATDLFAKALFWFSNIINKNYPLSKRNYRASVLQQCYHKEKCFIHSVIKTSSFSLLKTHVGEKLEIITAIVIHTLQSYGYLYYYWITFKTVSVFLYYSLTYYHKVFDDRSVLNTAILWMAMLRKQVTDRLYVAIFVRKSVLGLFLCKCICSHKLA